MRPESLWRDRAFLKLWAGQAISEIGTRISREGIPFTAVRMLNATTAQMGFLQGINGLATLVAGPWAGQVTDRMARRPILITADVGRALLLALIPYMAWRGTLSLQAFYFVVCFVGVLSVFFDVAYQSLLPSLVRREQLLEGNRKLQLAASTAEVVGPAVTGLLIQLLTAPRAILLDALSFLASAVCIAMIRRPEQAVPAGDRPATWRDMFAGTSYVFSHPLLRPLALRAGMLSFFGGFFSALYVLYAVRDLGIGPAMLGFIIAVGGVSSFIGALLAERVLRWFTLGHTLIGSAILAGLAALIIPLGTGPFYGALCLAAAQLFGDISFPIYNIHELTLRQKVAPPHLLGRVNGCMQMLFKGIWPLGAVVGGLLASNVGSRWTLVASGLGILLSSVCLIASPIRKLRGVE